MSYLSTYHLQNIIATNLKTTKKSKSLSENSQIQSNVNSSHNDRENEENVRKG